MTRKQQPATLEASRPTDITLFIDNEFIRFTALTLNGQVLIGHLLDEVIEVADLLAGVERGHLTTELRAVKA